MDFVEKKDEVYIFSQLMGFSIIKAILSWQAWKTSALRPSIRSRHRKRKQKLLPQRSARKRYKRTQRLMKRNRFREREKWNKIFAHGVASLLVTSAVSWTLYEVVMSALLWE